jgi:8-oxo-dGTP diphosphatase
VTDAPWTRLAAHGLCVDGDRILLARLTDETPNPGMWGLPGGGLAWGEHPEDGLRREMFEETGLTCTVGAVRGVYSITYHRSPERPLDSLHFVSVVYDATPAAGELVHEVGGSTDLAAWVDVADLARLPLAPLAAYGVGLLGLIS